MNRYILTVKCISHRGLVAVVARNLAENGCNITDSAQFDDANRKGFYAPTPEDYVSLGRDVEAQMLARAIHAHIHHRVFLNGNKTVVFPASPGSYASEGMEQMLQRSFGSGV
jgi:formyltetrahydrofolate hydrolase